MFTLHRILRTDATKSGYSCDAKIHSATHELSNILLKIDVRFNSRNIPPLGHILSLMNPFHILYETVH
jgi:hypothetical protein